jgi:hypothetical protein
VPDGGGYRQARIAAALMLIATTVFVYVVDALGGDKLDVVAIAAALGASAALLGVELRDKE